MVGTDKGGERHDSSGAFRMDMTAGFGSSCTKLMLLIDLVSRIIGDKSFPPSFLYEFIDAEACARSLGESCSHSPENMSPKASTVSKGTKPTPGV